MTTDTTLTQGRRPPDLSGFLSAHRGMRQEPGLLATIARRHLDLERARLAEEQIAMLLELVHQHSSVEDEQLWPLLRARCPQVRDDLARIEADHEHLDQLLASVGDRSRTLRARADDLQRLHESMASHLDDEERVAVPLILQHLAADEWTSVERGFHERHDRRTLPRLYGWLASASTPEQRAEALADVPAPVRVLFRVFWWPAYQRRARRLYGEHRPTLLEL